MDGQQVSTVVDMSALLGYVFTFLAAVVSAVAVAVINWLRQKAGLDKMSKDDIVRQYLNTAVENGVVWAKAKMAAEGYNTVDAKNELAALVLTYLNNTVPDALKHLGLTGDKAQTFVEGKLEGLLAKAAE